MELTQPLEENNLTPTPLVTDSLPSLDQASAVLTLEQGNTILQEAITLANEENLQKLQIVWQNQALAKAQTFAINHYNSYSQTFEVEFEYLDEPVISSYSNTTQVVIISRESWRYSGPNATDQESFEFIYTLIPREGQWVISDYTHRNLPDPE
jgi:hypothetical protein